MRKLISLLLLFVVYRFSAQVNLDSGLVACYPLNGNGLEFINGLDGAIGWSQFVTNQYQAANSALKLFGTTNSYVELPANTLLKGNALSFSAWIRPNYQAANSSYLVFTRSSSTATTTSDIAAYALCLETINGGKKLKVIKRTATQTYTLANTINLNFNQWYHVCFTCDGAEMAVYLDGVLSNTLTAPGTFAYQSGKSVYLGGSNESTAADPYYGVLDNIRFYNRVLTPQEVSTLYQNDPACIVATQPPLASFSLVANCVGQTIQLLDSSLNHPHTWHWNISGIPLANASLPNQTISPSAAGPYTVTLIVSNDLGTDTLVQTIQIYPQFSITVVPSKTYICKGETYVLTASANGMPTYTWNGSVVSPTFSTYHASSGIHVQTVTAIDTLGCSDTSVYYVKVNSCHTLTTGPDRELDEAVQIFPVPTSRLLFIDAGIPGLHKIELYNSVGQLIRERKPEKQAPLVIDLLNENAGVYIVQLYFPGGRVTRKIVKSD